MNRSAPLCATALALLATTGASARPLVEKPDNFLDDRFEVGADLTFTSSTTRLRVDSSSGAPGTEINAESDLNLPAKKTIGRLDVLFRPAPRHTIRANYLFIPFERSGTGVLKKDVYFKDNLYHVSETMSSRLDVRLVGVDYAYSVVRTDRVALGVAIGVEGMEFAADANVPARLAEQHEARSAPVPLIGVDGAARLSSRWYGEANWRYLKANVSQVHGAAALWNVQALYRLNPTVTLGIGYSSYHVSVDSLKVGDTGYFNLKTSGPMLSARVGF